MLCENFTYIGRGRVLGLAECRPTGLVSRWVRLVLSGSASAPLTERASRWVGMGSGESALSELSELSFMTTDHLQLSLLSIVLQTVGLNIKQAMLLSHENLWYFSELIEALKWMLFILTLQTLSNIVDCIELGTIMELSDLSLKQDTRLMNYNGEKVFYWA